jgi:predicted type IV restriction endonuclease
MTDDKANKLEEGFFDYQVSKDGKVFISWHNKQVVTLSGKQAQKFLAQIDALDGVDAQLVMARFTGNFKRGNERQGKNAAG